MWQRERIKSNSFFNHWTPLNADPCSHWDSFTLGELCDSWAEVSAMPTVPMLVMQNKVTPNSEKTFWMIMAQCRELRPEESRYNRRQHLILTYLQQLSNGCLPTRQGYTDEGNWLALSLNTTGCYEEEHAFITALLNYLIQLDGSFQRRPESHTHTTCDGSEHLCPVLSGFRNGGMLIGPGFFALTAWAVKSGQPVAPVPWHVRILQNFGRYFLTVFWGPHDLRLMWFFPMTVSDMWPEPG